MVYVLKKTERINMALSKASDFQIKEEQEQQRQTEHQKKQVGLEQQKSNPESKEPPSNHAYFEKLKLDEKIIVDDFISLKQTLDRLGKNLNKCGDLNVIDKEGKRLAGFLKKEIQLIWTIAEEHYFIHEQSEGFKTEYKRNVLKKRQNILNPKPENNLGQAVPQASQNLNSEKH